MQPHRLPVWWEEPRQDLVPAGPLSWVFFLVQGRTGSTIFIGVLAKQGGVWRGEVQQEVIFGFQALC